MVGVPMLKAERVSRSDPKLSDAQTRNFEAIKYRGMRAGRPRTRKGRLTPEGAGGPSALAGSREAPQTKEGTPSGPPLPGASSAPPRPKPRATRPGGRRRPTLPQGRPCSTLGAGRLNFRVRYGSGCAPAAVAAGPRGALRRGLLGRGGAHKAPWGPHSARGRWLLRTVGAEGPIVCPEGLGRLVAPG